jgi:thiol-disulfide isomerase/thioredoxin
MEETENQEPTAHFTPDPPTSRKKIFIPIVILLVVIVGALMTIKASVQKEAHLATTPVELNEGVELPNFSLNALAGAQSKVGDLPHKVMLINFWATWCEACMEEMPSLITLRDQYAAKGFEVLGINVDENPASVVPEAAKKLGIKFPIFTDKNNALAELFDVHAIPLSVVIDKNRKILLVETGGRDWNTEEIQQMMNKWLSE